MPYNPPITRRLIPRRLRVGAFGAFVDRHEDAFDHWLFRKFVWLQIRAIRPWLDFIGERPSWYEVKSYWPWN